MGDRVTLERVASDPNVDTIDVRCSGRPSLRFSCQHKFFGRRLVTTLVSTPSSADDPPAAHHDFLPFFTLSPLGQCIIGFDGRFIAFNECWAHILGHASTSIINRSVLSLV
ncbi:MAG: hypothetical protein AAFV29_25425, partial [Myxococcota bacterium]